jgi:hypothetical protein
LGEAIVGGGERICAIGRQMAAEYHVDKTLWKWTGAWIKSGIKRFSNSRGNFTWECVARRHHRDDVADGVDVIGMC